MMHEHGLADRLLAALRACQAQAGAAAISTATVEVSELAGVNAGALQMALDHVCEHQGIAPIQLTVEVPGLLGHCSDCGRVVRVGDDLACMDCGNTKVRLCGDETVVIKSCQWA